MTKTFEEVTARGQTLSQDQIDHFNEKGYIILPKFINDDEIQEMQDIKDDAEQTAMSKGDNFTDGQAHYDLEPLEGPNGKASMALRKVQEVFTVEKRFHGIMASDKMLDVVALHASAPNNSPKPRLSAITDFDSQSKPEEVKYGSREPLR